ncbi:hypothetical protein B6U99_05010 [Candidatus Geothermarchaeota archaeon ex4572_27]|nr:MAG: hypothetical protein B6U99_05010 [Candidatus Geothermarchaeota archaeon ex4572_27]
MPRYILVASGKGGTGKTTIAINLALAASKMGHEVGLVDCDFCAPNAHLIMGLPEERLKDVGGLLKPPRVNGVEFMSVAVAFPRGVGLAWSHDKVVDMLRALIKFVNWSCEYLFIDMPPSSIDVNVELLKMIGHVSRGVLVGEPHRFALEDNLRMLDLMRLYDVDVRAIILNKCGLYPGEDDAVRLYSELKVRTFKVPFSPDLAIRPQPDLGVWHEILKVVL